MTDKQMRDIGIHTEEAPKWELDPVCGMEVEPRTTPYQATYENHTYYFCNQSCHMHFQASPEQYAL